MERTLGDRFAALRDTVGYHLEQAAIYRREIAGEDESVTRLAQRAADHLEAAARHADAIGDHAVIRLLERANRLRAPDDPRRLSTLPLLARYLFLATRVDEAKAALDEVLASSGADPSTRAAALELNLGLSLGNSAAELRPGVEEALSIRRAVGEPAGIARALLALAELESFAGRYRHARELIDDALASAQKAGDVGLEAQLRRFRTAALFMSLPPRPEDRRSMLEEDLAFARKHGLLSMEAATLRSLGMARGLAGSRSQAKELIEQARAIHRDLGHEFWARMFFGDVLLDYWAGDKQLAADQWRALSHELAVVGEKAQLSEVAVELALCLLDLDETKEAEEALRTAEATGAPDNVITQVQLKAARARLLARHGDLPGAELMAREAVKDAEVAEVYFLAPRAHLALGDVLRLADRLGEAVTEWRQAIAIQDAFGNQLYADQLRRELTEIEEAGGTG
jgi:tetratricopeptide (TPR) repeat protein